MAQRTKAANDSTQLLQTLSGLFYETLLQRASKIQSDQPPCPKNDRVLDFLIHIGGDCPLLGYSNALSAPNSVESTRLLEAGSLFQGLEFADLDEAYERLADEGYDRFADEVYNRLAAHAEN